MTGTSSRADFLRNLADLIEVFVRLGTGFVDALERCTGELKLAARLQADRAAGRVFQADDARAFVDRLPTEALQAFQHCADAGLTLVRERRQRLQVEAEFFVLRADAPCALRLRAGRERVDEVGFRRNRAAACLRNGHGGTSISMTVM
jgi:hypothetical protein